MIKPAQPDTLDEAARILRAGGLVAFPTETVYGLGADAFNALAVARIFEVKQRPSFDPIIVHVGSPEAAFVLWKDVPPAARRLMDAFWPGPLTIALPKTDRVPDIVTAGLPTVAVRMPAHPVARELLARFGGPVAAPSANPFSRTSPTSAGDVWDDFGASVELIIDGGASVVGVESTVVKIESGTAVVLRHGGVTAEELAEHVPVRTQAVSEATGGALEAPGLMAVHYAPRTPLFLSEEDVPPADLWTHAERTCNAGRKVPLKAGILTLDRPARAEVFAAVEVLSGRGDLREAAKNLFGAMRRLDRAGLDCIVALPVSETGVGRAIMDRLRKASSGRGGAALEAHLKGARA